MERDRFKEELEVTQEDRGVIISRLSEKGLEMDAMKDKLQAAEAAVERLEVGAGESGVERK